MTKIKPVISSINNTNRGKSLKQLKKNKDSYFAKSTKLSMDFSGEERGYFTQKDAKGDIIRIFRTIFPR